MTPGGGAVSTESSAIAISGSGDHCFIQTSAKTTFMFVSAVSSLHIVFTEMEFYRDQYEI
jgi:hypothetical protein